MKRTLLATLLAAALVPATALACKKGDNCDCDMDKKGEHASMGQWKKVTVAELAELNKAGKVQLFDANTVEFRGKNGIIPGAKLLSSASSYDVAKELPAAKDSKLVFYCANTKCTASHLAAERAMGAGYTDVSVLPDGLMGWKGAGQPTAALSKS